LEIPNRELDISNINLLHLLLWLLLLLLLLAAAVMFDMWPPLFTSAPTKAFNPQPPRAPPLAPADAPARV